MKVSVLIQTYQHERYVLQAIEGALSQETRFPYEIIIGDDCSSDRTREIVTTIAKEYPGRVEFLFPRERQGPNELFLQLLGAARGEYVALLDGDDFWGSEFKLQEQCDFLDANGQYSICFHDVMRIFEKSPRSPQNYVGRGVGPEVGIRDLLRSNFIATCSAMFRRELARDLPAAFGEFVNLDWLLYIKLALSGSIGYIEEVMGVYRDHAAGVWSGKSRPDQLTEDIRAYRFLLGFLPAEYADTLHRCLLLRRIQLTVERLKLPYDRAVAVLTEDPDPDPDLLAYDGRPTQSLLESASDGVASHIEDGVALIAAVERARSEGAGFLLVPATSARMIGEETTLRQYVDSHYRRLWQGDDCTIVDLYACGQRTIARDGTSILRRETTVAGEVSVVIPCFNQGHFLEEALRSVMNQTLAPCEIIVVNDGSTDDTPDVAARFPGVHCISQPNAGLPAARNAGLCNATGEYVVFLDADDRLVTDALEIGVETFQRQPGCALVYGHCRFIDADGYAIPTPPQRVVSGRHYEELLAANFIWAPGSVMYKRTVFDRVGMFREGLKAAEDYDIYLRIARVARLAGHARPVVEYRKHGASMSSEPGRMLKYTHGVLRSQWLFTRHASALRRAYRRGKLVWQHYYGEATVDRAVSHAFGRRWRSAGRQLIVLGLHFPTGALAVILRYISPRAELSFFRKRVRRRERALSSPIASEDLARWIRCVVDVIAPETSTIAVASEGDDNFLSFERHEGRHFPARREASERKLFANAPSGSEEAPWIWPNCDYEFTLQRGETTEPIVAVTVRGRQELRGNARTRKTVDRDPAGGRGRRGSGLMLTATPNPVPIGNSRGATVLSWDTGNGSSGSVFVSVIHWPFDDGAVSSSSAAASLQAAMEDGAQFLVIPETSFWWLRICSEFKQALEESFRRVWSDEWCLIFELSGADQPRRP